MRELHIKPVLNGFVVSAGCQTVVYDSPEKLIADLSAYFHDPKETENRLLATGCNSKHTNFMNAEEAPLMGRASRVTNQCNEIPSDCAHLPLKVAR